VLALRQLYGDIRLILQCIQKSRFSSDALNDEIIMAAIKVLASQTKEVCMLVCCGKLNCSGLIAETHKLFPIQWNHSIAATIGNQHFVPYSEVSLTQGLLGYISGTV